MNATGWTQGPDGLFRAPVVFPGVALTGAQLRALPPYGRAWPAIVAGQRMSIEHAIWRAKHRWELEARIRGGAWAETYALWATKKGRADIGTAINTARALAPVSSPATFPTLTAQLTQAGRTTEAAWLNATPAQIRAARNAQGLAPASGPAGGIESGPATLAALALLLLL